MTTTTSSGAVRNSFHEIVITVPIVIKFYFDSSISQSQEFGVLEIQNKLKKQFRTQYFRHEYIDF